jgi:hypothetical protein
LSTSNPVRVETVMAELQDRVRARVQAELLQHGASPALEHDHIFAELDRILRDAVTRSQPRALLLPELMGDPSTWRIDTAVRYRSHRAKTAASLIGFAKRWLLMPVLRWFYEYSRDNFERQLRVNHVLFACVQELAIQNAELMHRIQQLEQRTAGRF